MANGKIGDHPLTDILTHDRVAYSERATDLIRQIVALADSETKRELSDRLLSDYNPYLSPDVERLEAELEDLLLELQKDAKARGFEPL